MNQLNRVVTIAVGGLLGAGCVQETAPTVEYFRAHRDERVALLQECLNDAARGKHAAACVDAREAERLESVGQLRDLPPVGLPPAPVNDGPQNSGGKRD